MDKTVDRSRLKRTVYEMPADIAAAIEARGLSDRYQQRPAYQQNDYVGWITRAKLPATRAKRLNQMLDELEQGGLYMKMMWRG